MQTHQRNLELHKLRKLIGKKVKLVKELSYQQLINRESPELIISGILKEQIPGEDLGFEIISKNEIFKFDLDYIRLRKNILSLYNTPNKYYS